MSSGASRRRSFVATAPVTTTVALVRGEVEVARWPLASTTGPDLAVVDQLARVQLAARRLGCSVRLYGADGHLVDLLHLTGLARTRSTGGELVVEVGGQPEGGEEVGVEEGVEPGYAVA